MVVTYAHLLRCTLALGIAWLAGCASVQPPCSCTSRADTAPAISPTPAIRQGRYTLVEIRPENAQKAPQKQIISLRIPATKDTTVGDALRYVLQRSGYQLCKGDPTLTPLFALPLPAAHMQLGPLALDETLQLLAGNTWRLSVDERARQVCFVAEEAQR